MSEFVVHVFQDSGYCTYVGGLKICRCGQIEKSRAHDVPPTPPEAREIDERKLGERV